MPLLHNKEEILKAAIEKAVKNGYQDSDLKNIGEDIYDYYRAEGFYYLIFSHDFAKAFWGEQIEWDNPNGKGFIGAKGRVLGTSWQYHLQKMVLEEDPISYLANFI